MRIWLTCCLVPSRDHAKLLWQRIPEEMKQLHEVLGQLWAIGKELWRKDFPAVYKLARTGAWPDLVAPLVESLVGKGSLIVMHTCNG